MTIINNSLRNTYLLLRIEFLVLWALLKMSSLLNESYRMKTSSGFFGLTLYLRKTLLWSFSISTSGGGVTLRKLSHSLSTLLSAILDCWEKMSGCSHEYHQSNVSVMYPKTQFQVSIIMSSSVIETLSRHF